MGFLTPSIGGHFRARMADIVQACLSFSSDMLLLKHPEFSISKYPQSPFQPISLALVTHQSVNMALKNKALFLNQPLCIVLYKPLFPILPSWFPQVVIPDIFGTRDQFHESQFLYGLVWGMVSGWFKRITFIVNFVCIIIMSAPPQTKMH